MEKSGKRYSKRKEDFWQIDAKVVEQCDDDRARGVFYGTPNSAALWQYPPRGLSTVFRPAFVRDVGKIINLPAYCRMQDKTQVLSLYKNDDISRRMLHVQIVSRIARDIAYALNLNVDLAEAIALGHDLGHTPFGHAGERMLEKLSLEATDGKLHFNHNVQSVRTLTVLNKSNYTLQTLDGILCHNGEIESKAYKPDAFKDFSDLFRRVDDCERNGAEAIKRLVPQTIEGCVVRVSDMIAYIGKDRQDARTINVGVGDYENDYSNAELINNLSADIINNSYGKGMLSMSDGAWQILTKVKKENYEKIYMTDEVREVYGEIEPMFEKLFYILLDDAAKDDGFIYSRFVKRTAYYNENYVNETPARKTCDFMASMTDDFFFEAYEHFTGKKSPIEYKGYFDTVR